MTVARRRGAVQRNTTKAATGAASKSPSKPSSSSAADDSKFYKRPVNNYGGAAFNAMLLGFVGTLFALDQVVGPMFAKVPAAATKPYNDFDTFFPFYLSEHSEDVNRRLHVVGTTISLLLAVTQPAVLAAVLYSGTGAASVVAACAHVPGFQAALPCSFARDAIDEGAGARAREVVVGTGFLFFRVLPHPTVSRSCWGVSGVLGTRRLPTDDYFLGHGVRVVPILRGVQAMWACSSASG